MGNLKTEICADQKLVHLTDDDVTAQHWLMDSSVHSKDEQIITFFFIKLL